MMKVDAKTTSLTMRPVVNLNHKLLIKLKVRESSHNKSENCNIYIYIHILLKKLQGLINLYLF